MSLSEDIAGSSVLSADYCVVLLLHDISQSTETCCDDGDGGGGVEGGGYWWVDVNYSGGRTCQVDVFARVNIPTNE